VQQFSLIHNVRKYSDQGILLWREDAIHALESSRDERAQHVMELGYMGEQFI
jgi:hypothetical protein